MKNYYLKNGSRENGPFMLDDLKYQRISPTTLVRVDGGTWMPITQVQDLKFLLDLYGIDPNESKSMSANTVFDQPVSGSTNQNASQAKSRLIFVIAIAIFIMAAGMAFAIFSMASK